MLIICAFTLSNTTQDEDEEGCKTPDDSRSFSFQITATLKRILKESLQEVEPKRERLRIQWNVKMNTEEVKGVIAALHVVKNISIVSDKEQ